MESCGVASTASGSATAGRSTLQSMRTHAARSSSCASFNAACNGPRSFFLALATILRIFSAAPHLFLQGFAGRGGFNFRQAFPGFGEEPERVFDRIGGLVACGRSVRLGAPALGRSVPNRVVRFRLRLFRKHARRRALLLCPILVGGAQLFQRHEDRAPVPFLELHLAVDHAVESGIDLELAGAVLDCFEFNLPGGGRAGLLGRFRGRRARRRRLRSFASRCRGYGARIRLAVVEIEIERLVHALAGRVAGGHDDVRQPGPDARVCGPGEQAGIGNARSLWDRPPT